MTTLIRLSVITATLILLSACNFSERLAKGEPVASSKLDKYSSGWNTIDTAGDTVCSDGSAYKFFFRPGLSEKLMVYFQGGGACWSGSTCDPDLEPSYKINLSQVDPGVFDGILNFNNSENPLTDYSIVFVPYCSADVHIGDTLAEYQAPATGNHQSHPVRIEHRGYINVDAVLEWTYSHFFNPESIFVTGSSAGSIPSPYYAMVIADHYPDSRVTQLGDGSGGYRSTGDVVLPQTTWATLQRLLTMPEFTELNSRPFGYTDLYIAAAQRHEQMQLAQYDTAEDKIQKHFLELLGIEPTKLFSLILANHEEIRASVKNYNIYVAGGDLHTILLRPEFYTYHVDGLPVRDWVADLVAGKVVTDVKCNQCDRAEIIGVEVYEN